MHILRFEWFMPIFQGVFLGLLAMTVHEAGHMVAARLAGIKVSGLGVSWKGMYTLRETGSARGNMFVSLAGPLVNLALLALWHWNPTFGLANLCFFGINALPIQGSDGERAWRCWNEMQRRSVPVVKIWSPQGPVARKPLPPAAGEFTD